MAEEVKKVVKETPPKKVTKKKSDPTLTVAKNAKKATKKKSDSAKKALEKKQKAELLAKKAEALKGYKRFERVRNRYFSFLKSTVRNSKPTTDLFNTVRNHKAVVSGFTRNEIKRFDHKFIEEIERVIPSLETIVVSPHKFINEFSEIVQVEKARKITPRAVKFMAQNTQFISEIRDDGVVIPKKVLNVFVDDDIKIYENRFIMTLVKRLQIFIELRYKYIQEHGDTKNSDQIEIKKEVMVDGVKFEFEGKLKMSVPSDDEGTRQSNIDLLERLASIRKRTLYLVTSPFMKEMAKAIPVADPIQQTNIIRLNYAYQDAYKLWMFINKYDELGISYTTTQAKVDFDEKYMEQIDQLILNSLLTIRTEHGRLPASKVRQKVLKPFVVAGALDFDISDERFFEGGLPIKVSGRQETVEQLAARIKREEAREKARLKREAKRQKDKERLALLKAREKEKAKQKKIKERELAKERQAEAKRRQEEKNLERARQRAEKEKIKAERAAFQAKLREEARKLREARIAIAKLAEKEKADEERK